MRDELLAQEAEQPYEISELKSSMQANLAGLSQRKSKTFGTTNNKQQEERP